MQLDVGLGAPRDQASERIERHLAGAMQNVLVQLVKGKIRQAGEQTFQPDVAAHETAHQVADRGVFAQRNEGAEVAIAPRAQRLAVEPASESAP